MLETWGDLLQAIAQDIYDLMANQPIRVEIEGEVGSVDGSLYLRNHSDREWKLVAEVISADTMDDCLGELLGQIRSESAEN